MQLSPETGQEHYTGNFKLFTAKGARSLAARLSEIRLSFLKGAPVL